MRLIFFSLLGINLLIGAWGMFFASTDDFQSTASSVGESSVVKVMVPSLTDKSVSAEPAEGVASRLCELVGAFDSDEAAGLFVERLLSIGIESSTEHIELPAGESYWVHLPPEETPEAAFRRLSELQSQGVESYVIGRGELKNAVSLGVFTFRHLADARLSELKQKGLAPEIKTMARTQVETWVMLKPEEAEKMSDLTWERMLEGMTSQERRQNFCLPVAS